MLVGFLIPLLGPNEILIADVKSASKTERSVTMNSLQQTKTFVADCYL
jgi:hypothetical protein